MRKYFSKKINGFTLVELLVVIAIIGILSSLSVVSLNSARGRARDAQRYNDLRQLFTAMTLYYDTRTTTPQYPEMFDDTHKYVSDAAPGWWVGIVGSNRFFPTPLKDPKIGEASAYPFAKQIDTNPNDTFDDKLQHYCVYTKLEGANNYLIVTERGLSSKEVPSTGDWDDNTDVCVCDTNLCTDATGGTGG